MCDLCVTTVTLVLARTASSNRNTALAMSQENVELARRFTEAINRTFAEGTPDLYEVLDPKVEWIPMTALLDGTPYHGHEGVRHWMEDMKRDWAIFELMPERFLDLGAGRVLTLGRWRAQGRGKLVQLRTFTDRKKALDAAGLQE
jgi:ketosteroid isomerase-like protein